MTARKTPVPTEPESSRPAGQEKQLADWEKEFRTSLKGFLERDDVAAELVIALHSAEAELVAEFRRRATGFLNEADRMNIGRQVRSIIEWYPQHVDHQAYITYMKSQHVPEFAQLDLATFVSSGAMKRWRAMQAKHITHDSFVSHAGKRRRIDVILINCMVGFVGISMKNFDPCELELAPPVGEAADLQSDSGT